MRNAAVTGVLGVGHTFFLALEPVQLADVAGNRLESPVHARDSVQRLCAAQGRGCANCVAVAAAPAHETPAAADAAGQGHRGRRGPPRRHTRLIHAQNGYRRLPRQGWPGRPSGKARRERLLARLRCNFTHIDSSAFAARRAGDVRFCALTLDFSTLACRQKPSECQGSASKPHAAAVEQSVRKLPLPQCVWLSAARDVRRRGGTCDACNYVGVLLVARAMWVGEVGFGFCARVAAVRAEG